MRFAQAARVAQVAHSLRPLRANGVGRYRVAGQNIQLRNGTRDVSILADIFSRHDYEPPVSIAPRSVLDLGANIGLFSAWAKSRWPVERLVCVEPDPENLVLLDRNVEAEIVRACAGIERGSTGFEGGHFSESRVGNGPEVPVVDVFDLGHFDLVKIDIEGSEWPLLQDPRLSRLADWLVMEAHWDGRPASDSPKVIAGRLLGKAGYRVVSDRGVVWAHRSRLGRAAA